MRSGTTTTTLGGLVLVLEAESVALLLAVLGAIARGRRRP
jgi:NADH:ubiquinone oxidoreductase subunit 6 (subunit J)